MSSDTAIRIENIGKQYRLGNEQGGMYRYKSLRDSLGQAVRRPLDVLRQNRRLTDDNSFWALKDVSFEVKKGEVVGIIGRNGAGKSTLLKILSRITKPTTGQIELHGRVGSLLEVGTGFHPELTGRENIYLNGAILGMTRAEVKAKFDEIVAFSEIEKFLDTPVKQYSSGMYTRLAFAVAAHLEPEILVVDEVLAVGDAAFQKKCLGKMKDVAGEGRTVLFVSHNMNTVSRLCGHAVYLEQGRVFRRGAVRSVVSQYLSSMSSGSVWVAEASFKSADPVFNAAKLQVRNHGESDGDVFRADTPIDVILDGVVARQDQSLCVGIAVYGGGTELLFLAFHNDRHPSLNPILQRGYVRLSTRLPAHFLNEGTHRIELVAKVLSEQRWIYEPGRSPITVELEIHGGLSESPHWTQKRRGHLAPVLAFNSEDIS